MYTHEMKCYKWLNRDDKVWWNECIWIGHCHYMMLLNEILILKDFAHSSKALINKTRNNAPHFHQWLSLHSKESKVSERMFWKSQQSSNIKRKFSFPFTYLFWLTKMFYNVVNFCFIEKTKFTSDNSCRCSSEINNALITTRRNLDFFPGFMRKRN